MIQTEKLTGKADILLEKALKESRQALILKFGVRAVPEVEVVHLSRIVKKFLTSSQKAFLAEAILAKISDVEIDVQTFNTLYAEVLSWY